MDSSVKIVRPRLPPIVERRGLLRELHRICGQHKAVWVAAPPGAGKTTLVSHYLERERVANIWYQTDDADDLGSLFHYLGLAAKRVKSARYDLPRLASEHLRSIGFFSRRYFDALYNRVGSPFVLVFDNYQEIPNDSPIHEVLCEAVVRLPAGMNAIIISRIEPPAALARLRASGSIGFVGWEQLKLSSKECAAMVRLRGLRLPRAAVRRLETLTQGWAAGLVLALEGKSAGVDLTAPAVPQVVFDYFTGEIFARATEAVRDLLLQAAFVPAMTPRRICALTGNPHAVRVIEELAERNYFTSKTARSPAVYQFHPLFREFLRHRAAAVYSPGKLLALKRRGAQVLAESGDLENAISLLQEAQDWSTALALMLENARTLVDQGRMQTLGAWLASLPDTLLAENAWALYWLGVCRLPFAPSDARRYFIAAFDRFEKGNDASPLYLAWSGVVGSFLLEWNDFAPLMQWIEKYPTLSVDRKPPSPEIENSTFFSYLSALFQGRPDDPALPSHAERAERLLRAEPDEDRRFARATPVIIYYLRRGDMTRTGHLLAMFAGYAANPNALPLARLNWYTWKASHAFIVGANDEALRASADGLAIAETSDIHALDMVLLGYRLHTELCAGNVSAARATLDTMSRLGGHARISGTFYHHLAALLFLQEGNIARALDEALRAVELARDSRSPLGLPAALIALATIYGYQGKADLAVKTIAEGLAAATHIRSNYALYVATLAEANIHRLGDAPTESLRALEQALRLGQETGMSPQAASCPRADVAHLFARALEAGLYPSYVRTTIARMRLAPPCGLVSENWPWRLKLYTLGRFAVIKDEVQVTFTRKTQKKPLELLCLLIALGGRGVGATKLAHTLWPETDGDMAAHALETTIYRLRKLLGERAIVLKNRQLDLDLEHCWCDVLALEHLIDDATTPPVARAEKLPALYRGEFLSDNDSPWALLQRERLRSKFLREVAAIGDALEAHGDLRRAAELYQKAIEIDPLAETIYRRLMSCYQQLGRCAEALGIYQRCRATLSSVLDMEPARETQMLVHRIQSTAS